VKWLSSTSNRVLVLWPVVVLGGEAALQWGFPRVEPWALPILLWGYLQYRLVGRYRLRQGGGGPGLSVPPERLVTAGPYRFCRNPMYLGHLIFLAGLALALRSGLGAVVFAGHAIWFQRRVRSDEKRLAVLFGDPYRDYVARVKRWVPGIF